MICENCFDDHFLKDEIRARGNALPNDCTYCESTNVHGIDPTDLIDIVSPILGAYNESEDEEAKPLLFYLRRDWSLLERPSSENANRILNSIFPGESIDLKRFQSRKSQTLRVRLWDDFQSELKHKNRFFPKTEVIDEGDLKDLFNFLILKNPPSSVFRARLCDKKEPYRLQEMGRPPEHKTKEGRANPIGISYLYTASDVKTAIAEVRPSVGDLVCVAEFFSNSKVTLLDLRDPKQTISPFEIGADNILKLLNEVEFLCRLGEQLSKAILPKEAALEYVASQYLCEMIKHFRYDGVVYKSSVGSGFNIAFFDDSKLAHGSNVLMYSVTGVSYTAEEYKLPSAEQPPTANSKTFFSQTRDKIIQTMNQLKVTLSSITKP